MHETVSENVKTQVDPCPHISILLGLDSNDGDHCVTEQFMQIFVKKSTIR